jgi:hypothetical protein
MWLNIYNRSNWGFRSKPIRRPTRTQDNNQLLLRPAQSHWFRDCILYHLDLKRKQGVLKLALCYALKIIPPVESRKERTKDAIGRSPSERVLGDVEARLIVGMLPGLRVPSTVGPPFKSKCIFQLLMGTLFESSFDWLVRSTPTELYLQLHKSEAFRLLNAT